MSKRKLKHDSLYHIGYDLDDKNIDNGILFIKEKIKDLSKQYAQMNYKEFIFKFEERPYDDYGKELYICGVREENDAEYNKRISEEEAQEKSRTAFELKQLEHLQKKYGKV